jgi:hypothetical protein
MTAGVDTHAGTIADKNAQPQDAKRTGNTQKRKENGGTEERGNGETGNTEDTGNNGKHRQHTESGTGVQSRFARSSPGGGRTWTTDTGTTPVPAAAGTPVTREQPSAAREFGSGTTCSGYRDFRRTYRMRGARPRTDGFDTRDGALHPT